MLYLLNCITETIQVTEGCILASPDLQLSYKISYNTESREKMCEVSTSVVKWSDCLSNMVSIIIRIYIDHIWLFLLSHFFYIFLFLSCIIVYMVVCFVCFCLIL
jgi:hypothetical protein